MKLPFFTIGHSRRSLEEFVEMLGSADIALLVDIRTVPRSRTNPASELGSGKIFDSIALTLRDYSDYSKNAA